MSRESILVSKYLALLCALLLFYALIGREFRKAQIRTVNYFMPGSYAALLDPAPPLDPRVFDRYIIYYKIISAVIRGNADAYAMLGFCYSRMGRDDPAIRFLEKAIALKPQSFWIAYDLGVLYLKQGDYTKASRALTRAVHITPQTAFEAIYSSKVYVDILRDQRISPQIVAGQLEKGYQNAHQLLRSGLNGPAYVQIF